MKTRRLIGSILLHAVLLSGAFLALLPFFSMLATSFKVPEQMFVMPPQWLPEPVTLRNYEQLFTYIPFARQFFNTLFVTVTIVAGQLLFSSMGAYAFARLKFPGREQLFLLFLATLMVPTVVTLIPSFILVREFGWINTYMAIIGPYFLGSAIATFLLRQFMLTIPENSRKPPRWTAPGTSPSSPRSFYRWYGQRSRSWASSPSSTSGTTSSGHWW